MKFDKNNKYLTIFIYVLVCAVIITAFAVVCFNFKFVASVVSSVIGIIKPIIYALVFAFIIYPILKYFYTLFAFLERKKPHAKLREGLSLASSYLVVAAAVLTFISSIIPQVVSSYNDISQNAPTYIQNAQEWIDDLFDSIPDFNFSIKGSSDSGDDLSNVELIPYELVKKPQLTVFDKRNSEMFNRISDLHDGDISIDVSADLQKALVSLYNMVGSAMPYVWSFLGNAFTELKNIVLGLIMSIYILSTRKYLKAQLKKLICGIFSDNIKEKLYKVGKVADHAFIKFINYRMFDSLLVGIAYYLVLKLFGVPYTLLIAVLFAVMTLIPFIGAFIAFLPSFLIVLIFDPTKLLIFSASAVVISILNWQIMHKVYRSEDINLPVVYIIVSVIVMGGLFGIGGMFLATPITMTIRALFRDRFEKISKPECTESVRKQE